MKRNKLSLKMYPVDYIFCFTFVFVVNQITAQGVVCKNDTVCGSGECCYIKPPFEVVSRRQASILPVPVIPGYHDTGFCEKYHVEHEACGMFEKPNGHCGCEKGLSCVFVPAVMTTQSLVVSKKRDIFMQGPGSFRCEMTS